MEPFSEGRDVTLRSHDVTTMSRFGHNNVTTKSAIDAMSTYLI